MNLLAFRLQMREYLGHVIDIVQSSSGSFSAMTPSPPKESHFANEL